MGIDSSIMSMAIFNNYVSHYQKVCQIPQYMGRHPKAIDFHSIIFQDGHSQHHQADPMFWLIINHD